MKAFLYNEEGYLSGEGIVQIDPLESKIKGEKIYIMPANSTTEEPLKEKEGFNVKWDGKKWFYEEQEKYIPSEDELKAEKREERNFLLQETDKYMIVDFPISDEDREKLVDYRRYLRDYTKGDKWWEESPKTFEDWK